MNENSAGKRGSERGYVDRRTAEGIQQERAGGSGARPGTHSRNGGSRPDRPGLLGRLRRALGGGGRNGIAMAASAMLLAASACTSTGPTDGTTEAPDPTPTTTASPSPSPAQADSAVCDDTVSDDLVVFMDGVPTSQEKPPGEVGSDLDSVTLESEGDALRVSSRRVEAGSTPDELDLELHLQSTTDASETGVVRIGFRPGATNDLSVSAGPTTSELSPIEPLDSAVGQLTVTASVPFEDLPVQAPFAWYLTTHEGGLVGDVCPDVTGFTPDAALPVFPEDAEASAASADTVEVTGVDYAFEGLDDEVPAGTRLTFTNESEQEAHEMVAIRLTEETPPVDEFLQLPMEEGMAVTELVGVSIAMPGESGMVTKGDLLLDEPGQYLLLCALPIGAPPEQIAANPYGPPPGAPPPDSPPHFAEGMLQVVTVEG